MSHSLRHPAISSRESNPALEPLLASAFLTFDDQAPNAVSAPPRHPAYAALGSHCSATGSSYAEQRTREPAPIRAVLVALVQHKGSKWKLGSSDPASVARATSCLDSLSLVAWPLFKWCGARSSSVAALSSRRTLLVCGRDDHLLDPPTLPLLGGSSHSVSRNKYSTQRQTVVSVRYTTTHTVPTCHRPQVAAADTNRS